MCIRDRGTHAKLLDQARRSGYVRAEIDGNVYELSEEITLDKNIKHTIAIIVDRLIVKPGIEKRLTDSLETVLNLADGLAVVDTMDGDYMNFSPVSYTHLLEVALLIVEIASFNATSAAALSLFATAASTFLMEVLTAERMDLFLAAFVLLTKILFFADLMLANSYTSNS